MKQLVFRMGGTLVLLLSALSSPALGGQIPAAPPSASPVPGYVIGPDDVLSVTFWRDQMTADVVVRPDGRISLPLLNDVQAAGYTPEGLARALEQSASKFIT